VKRSIVKGITGSPKSNKVRYIPFSTQTGEVLQKWKKVSGPVFTKIGIPINQKSPYRALWRYRDRAGLPRVGWHTFRHTFASQLATRGVPMRSIQELLGHSDIRTTMRYAHLQESALRQAIEVLDCVEDKNFGQQVVNSSPLSSLELRVASPITS